MRNLPFGFFKKFRNVVGSATFVRPLVISPIVFSGVYVVIREKPDVVVACLFAFENGFFCESVFNKNVASKSNGEVAEKP